MIQAKRQMAVSRLIGQIENGDVVALDLQDEIRFVFQEHLSHNHSRTCQICNTPLVGRQEFFCFGHWDYVIVDLPLNQPYAELLKGFALWLRNNLMDSEIVYSQHHWKVVINGHSRCEVCDRSSAIVEQLVNHNGSVLKKHIVCHDHASFQLVE